MARNAASTISERTFLRCSRQRSLRASTFTPGWGPGRGIDGLRTKLLYPLVPPDLLYRAVPLGPLGPVAAGTIIAEMQPPRVRRGP
ncbi:hypothetical protein MARA_20280 [Mycolicibacterium arabiense]|uniref:Uncharacterized protein n=1 Tax=Mycolicibacterium arabiense TaxID=1286181 RepID=A0A7I7RWI5_9MYCO|nr:hypothetical protein MARA_20280 [Mycolicibacterium arabiense]